VVGRVGAYEELWRLMEAERFSRELCEHSQRDCEIHEKEHIRGLVKKVLWPIG
jgi:hypothetical protein